MPGMDGYELARRLREKTADHPPVLATVTAYEDYGHLTKAADAGFDLHFTKPADPGEVLDQLGDCVRKQTVERARPGRTTGSPTACWPSWTSKPGWTNKSWPTTPPPGSVRGLWLRGPPWLPWPPSPSRSHCNRPTTVHRGGRAGAEAGVRAGRGARFLPSGRTFLTAGVRPPQTCRLLSPLSAGLWPRRPAAPAPLPSPTKDHQNGHDGGRQGRGPDPRSQPGRLGGRSSPGPSWPWPPTCC